MPSVRSGEAEIRYEVFGRGPAVVFAHGAGGNRLSWWQQVPHFARRHAVVTFDHRCFGGSTCPPGAFHPRHFAGDLLAILDAEGIERAALVCQSMGGWTGLHTALRHPERVACLVLAGTPGGLWIEPVLEAARRIGSRAAAEGIQGQAALAPDFPAREPALAFLYDQINALNTGVDPALLGRLFDAEARVVPEALAGFATPTLLLAGEEDQLFPPEALEAVASHVPGAELRRFPGIGHSVYFEDAPAFNRVVLEFVSKHRPASGS
jgi:pimeloyl-ACP methyl ester carboxylesterase